MRTMTRARDAARSAEMGQGTGHSAPGELEALELEAFRSRGGLRVEQTSKNSATSARCRHRPTGLDLFPSAT
jgi:hypothetical protein